MREALTAVERELFADLDDDEIAQFHRLLGRIRTSPGAKACSEAPSTPLCSEDTPGDPIC